MNSKNLMELVAAVAATAALFGCVSAPTPQHTSDTRQEADRELGIARKVWAECVRTVIPGMDDSKSPSDVVARAAMKRCSTQYADLVRVLPRTIAPTCGRDPECTRGELAKAQREATKTATDDVVDARVRAAAAQVLKCQ